MSIFLNQQIAPPEGRHSVAIQLPLTALFPTVGMNCVVLWKGFLGISVFWGLFLSPSPLLFIHLVSFIMSFMGGASGKESTCQCRRHKRWGFNSWVRMIPWRRAWSPTPVFLPGETHGQRRLAGYSLKSWTWLKRLSMHACKVHNGFIHLC